MLEFDLRGAMPDSLVGVLDRMGLEESLLDSVAASARAKWIRLAQVELKATAQTYIEGIQDVRAERGVRMIQLAGWLPNAIEQGLPAFDLRDTILHNPRAKARRPLWSQAGRSGGQVQVGWYANIPFRHGTPGTTGLAGSPMGSLYGPRGDKSRRQGGDLLDTEQAAEFGKQVYRDAKKLRTKRGRRPAGQMGEKAVQQSYEGAGGKGKPLLRPHHQTSIYAGMRRERKPYVNPKTQKTTVQSQYITFRRISTENTEGWDHPGIEARNFAQQVLDHVAKITPAVVETIVTKALEGGGG